MVNDTLLLSTVIGEIRYDEYELLSLKQDITGIVRKSLEIWILSRTADISGIFTSYAKPLSDFDRVIIKLFFEPNEDLVSTTDELTGKTTRVYQEVPEYTLDLNNLDGNDTVKKLVIVGPNANVKLKINLRLESVITVDPNTQEHISNPGFYQELYWLRLENCVLDDGFSVYDRTKMLVEIINCTIYERFQMWESRYPNPVSAMNLIVENTVFNNLKSFKCSRLARVELRRIRFEFDKRTQEDIDKLYAEQGITSASEYVSPDMSISMCAMAIVDGCHIENIRVPFDLNGSDELIVNNITATHIDISAPLKATYVIRNGIKASVSNFRINGLVADTMESIQVATMHLTDFDCKNAPFALKILRCTKSINVVDVDVSEFSVFNGVDISTSEADINMSDCKFRSVDYGVAIKACSGKIVITDAVFIENKRLALSGQNLTDRIIVMDSSFTRNISTINIQQSAKVDIINLMVVGQESTKDMPNAQITDINFSGLGTLAINSDTQIRNCTINFESIETINCIESNFVQSYLLANVGVGTVKFSQCILDLSGVKRLPQSEWFMHVFSTFKMFMCEVSNVVPKIMDAENVDIQDCKFNDGLYLESSGRSGSVVKTCTFGTSDKSSMYMKGLRLERCHGIRMSGNMFYLQEGVNAIELANSMYNIVDETNSYIGKSQIIDASKESSLNMNHIIINTTLSDEERPKIKSTNAYRQALYVLNPTEHKRLGYQIPTGISTIYNVLGMALNIVSYVNPEESWVLGYLASLNTSILDASTNI